ncbi:hypothetical protein AAH178_002915 [Serratia marcescens]
MSQYLSVIAWVVVLLIVVVAVKGVRENGDEFKLIKDWSSKNSWSGTLTTATLISWEQTKAMNNFDYFYVFTFEIDGLGGQGKHRAAGVVKVAQASLLKKGMKLTVKYHGIPPTKIAVESFYWPDE